MTRAIAYPSYHGPFTFLLIIKNAFLKQHLPHRTPSNLCLAMAIDMRASTYAPFDASASTSRHAQAQFDLDPDSELEYDAPPYSAEPALDERMLERTRSPRDMPTGTVVRGNEHFTLTFNAQVPGAEIPTYGRHALIRGGVALACRAGVESVDIKVRPIE